MNKDALAAEVATIDGRAELVMQPCGDGEMPFRRWNGGAQETVVLVHGGSGSWTHWIRNIEPLSAEFEVIAPDLPGLGDATALPRGYSADDAARWTAEGIANLVSGSYHLVGFSWGSTVSSLVAEEHNERLKSLMLVGPAAMGTMPRRMQMKPLQRRDPSMTEDEIIDTNRENLARLMIHDRDRVDDLAAWLQTQNTNRSRFNSPQFALTTLVLDALRSITAPLYVMYGEFDAPAYPNIEAREQRLRAVRPDLRFEVIEGGGHWIQYECAELFNDSVRDWIAANA
jgi:pimeloyl-ACP methyl ester carboxylesterase